MLRHRIRMAALWWLPRARRCWRRTADGPLGAVYRVGQDGSVQMIIDGHMVTVPAATLSSVDGRLTTRLTKSEILALH